MIVMNTEIVLEGISGNDIYRFMLYCTDEDYQKWWSGTHLAFHTLRRYPDDLGNIVVFDEYVGKKRLRFEAVVIEIIPGRKIVWQMKKMIKLPGWLALSFEDSADGVRITHSLHVGFNGAGIILDPILRLFLSKKFEKELEQHAQIEFASWLTYWQD